MEVASTTFAVLRRRIENQKPNRFFLNYRIVDINVTDSPEDRKNINESPLMWEKYNVS